MSNKVINPLKGATDKSWFFEQQVYDTEGIARAIKSTDGSGNVPKVIVRKNEYKAEHIDMKEPKIIDKVIQVGNIMQEKNFANPQSGRIYSTKGLSPTINTCGGGQREPKIINDMAEQRQIELPEELRGKKFRIRKLTPKECFRLMDVDDKDIDKIRAAEISNSAQYKLAGNSIVVNVLFHLFRKMFIEKENEAQQLTLF